MLVNIILFINIKDNIIALNNRISTTDNIKEIKLSVSANIEIMQPTPAPIEIFSGEGEDTIGMGARSIYADAIDELTDYEKELIYKITWREAGNQCVEGKRAVIEVILNRLMDETWPNTIEGVLSQPRQFTTWAGRNSVSQENINSIAPILDIVYEEEPILTDKYFYFNGVPFAGMNNLVQIQDHWFGTR